MSPKTPSVESRVQADGKVGVVAQQGGDARSTRFCTGVRAFLPADATRADIEKTVWQQLLATRKDKALVAAINEVFGIDAEQLNLPPAGRLMVLLPEVGLPLDSFGSGTRAALRALLVLATMQGTLFIIEEPECHQHPASLMRFSRVLTRLAKSQEVQLLLSTHSVECMKCFVDAATDIGSEAAVFHLKLDEGHLESRKLDHSQFESFQATGLDVRELDLYV